MVRQEKHGAIIDIRFWLIENRERKCAHTPIWVPLRVSTEGVEGRWGEGGDAENHEQSVKNLRNTQTIFFLKSLYTVPRCLSASNFYV